MKIMGLDYGDKTIGVAVSDEFGWTAQGLEVIRRTSKAADLARLQNIIQEHGVEEIVVGLPKNMNNTIGPRGELSMEFAEALQTKVKLPVHLWDERLTTVSAERTLLEADVSRKKRRQVIDKIAAAFILQGFLDSNKRR
ncbi:Holliday junction resolvase RuvX [Paenibacillus sp. J2TS4]|uniref:Holliday junction resolvase RuvX n=1 Tax=Paenibacillus sp. J2TS4 TaxID=2807194 RepID=UPI001B260739|nr:Holliday junction resolvase RuvX [Paenibacillus sp. J2TS4]GIP31442.1 putative pre-16S rRNA nuclease [Paenibacillus sp. J2TS4]